jgi:KAP-like P-loop domain-containing protein
MTTAPETTDYWFYQLTSAGEFETLARSRRLPTGNVPQGSVEQKVGDIIFIWVGGSEAGLRGWGIVTANPIINQPSSSTPPHGLDLTSIDLPLALDRPIPRAELASYPGLSDAPLIRQNQTGSYFRLSAEQAFGLCDFLRARNLPAPQIAVHQVLAPIARRVERELAALRKVLPEVASGEETRQLSALAATAEEKLRTDGPVAAYRDIVGLVEALASVLKAAPREKASAYAPLDAARSQLLNDVMQIARFTDASDRVQELKTAAPPAAAPSAPPPIAPAPAAAQPVPPAPPIAPAPASQTSLPRPKDPLFRFWEQTDLIGIGAAVNNLSRYIAHEALKPPVAIGVFGDWGSGKSFFIRALQSQIALLSSQSRDALRDGRTTVFCSHIVQIEFNAWHFVESNLWASLAAHIFDRLYAELQRRATDEGANSNIDALYQQFSAYKQAVAEQERLNKLVDTLTTKRTELEEQKRSNESTVKVRLAKLAEVVRDQLGTLASQQLTKSERQRLNELLRASNLEELSAAQADASATVAEGRTFLGRVRAQLEWWGGWQLTMFAVVAAAIVFGVPWLVSKALDVQAGSLEHLVALISGYASLGAVGLAWVARSGRGLIAAAQKVERVLVETRSRVENTPDPSLETARRDVANAQSQLMLVDQQIADQRTRLAELADDVDPNQLGTRLQAFLDAKVKSDAYQKHLGLISLVRKDFSSLYDLMQRYWDRRKQPVPEVLTEVRDALGVLVRDTQKQVPFIERIVLYIDDLDRCPEDKVVEVLQAVHLMLGLPLFVVVVAVDVRWVGQSIRKYYGRLVGWDETGVAAPAALQSASADDYLEKIFQIPYRIHPLDPEVRKVLLGGLLRQPYLSGTSGDDPQGIVIQQELVPKELSLYPQELEAIEQLYKCVGSSPRRVRRLLDVYRLMRAGMEEGDVQDLIAKRHFAVILALFALLSGAPATAPRVIELLRKESLRLPDDPKAQVFVMQTMTNWAAVTFPATSIPADEAEVIASAMSYVDGLGFPRPDLVAILRKWIPEIGRYSFREVRMQGI